MKLLISTWNVYGMPFTSPKLLNRQTKWRSEHHRLIVDRIKDNEKVFELEDSKGVKNINCLSVACFQECWTFRVGLLKPLFYVVRFLEKYGIETHILSYISKIWTKQTVCKASDLSILLYVLTIPFGNFFHGIYWNTYKYFQTPTTTFLETSLTQKTSNTMYKNKYNIPYIYYIGNRSIIPFPKIYQKSILSAGLFMIANKEPTYTGFTAFSTTTYYESFVRKGVLWTYFDKEATLIINTHLVDRSDSIYQQVQIWNMLKIIENTIHSIKQNEYTVKMIVIAADLNCTPYGNSSKILEDFGYVCISNKNNYTHTSKKTLDYIYVKKIGIDTIKYMETHPINSPLSDHSILYSIIE